MTCDPPTSGGGGGGPRPRRPARPRVVPRLLLLVLAALPLLAGCHGSPALWERDWIESGERSLVLVRLTLGDAEGTRASAGALGCAVAVMDFDSGAAVKPLESYFGRSFSRGAARDGWVFMLLRPGTYYLVAGQGATPATAPPPQALFEPDENGLVETVRLRIDVPERTPVLYAGSVHLKVHRRRAFFGLESSLVGIDTRAVSIRDERGLAGQLLARHVPWAPPAATALMARHRGPTLQFRAPTLAAGR